MSAYTTLDELGVIERREVRDKQRELLDLARDARLLDPSNLAERRRLEVILHHLRIGFEVLDVMADRQVKQQGWHR
jgi:hypothetical protein